MTDVQPQSDQKTQDTMSVIREVATDTTAVGILAVTAYRHMIATPEFFTGLAGAAAAYLFIKHSPNSEI